MDIEHKKIKYERKIASFEKIAKEQSFETVFSKGSYYWVMFILNFYSKVRQALKIDFESFVIFQTVVSHNLCEKNNITSVIRKNAGSKLTFVSIASVLDLLRETFRRKVLLLSKKDILFFNRSAGPRLSSAYKSIYEDFFFKTTLDLGILTKQWKKSGALEKLCT